MHLDLNLLVALDALLEEGSVMGAAERLHLSSPAVSRTLGRLRKLTGDDILVRTGRTMTPTPYAAAIREEVHRLVREVHDVLAPSRELNLAELDRAFTLQCHDAVATLLAPVLVGMVQQQAPGVQLRMLAEDPIDTDSLRHGHVDLEIGGGRPTLPEVRSEILGYDTLVVVMRPGHPCSDGPDLASYASHQHVLVSRRGRLTAPIDDVLAAEGLRRRIVAAVPTVAMALHVASRSDMLVTTTATISRPLVEVFGLITRPLPVDFPAAPVYCNWHQRYDSDAAHAWLRDQVRAAVAQVVEG